MTRLRRRCGLAIASVTAACALAGSALAAPSDDADAIAARLRSGEPVVLREGTTVQGDLVLARENVRGTFKCRACVFLGGISAADATFERAVDLTASTFTHDVDFAGATFRGPALFRTVSGADGEPRTPQFAGSADFSLAVFDAATNFDGALFARHATFQHARLADATFAGAIFLGQASFSGTQFLGPSDFPSASFMRGATFKGARFASGATFLSATFDSPAHDERLTGRDAAADESEEAADFSLVTSAGNLVFARAQFRSVPGEQVAIFDDLESTGSLDLGRAAFLSLREPEDDERYATRSNRLALDGITGGLVFPLADVGSISNGGRYDGARERALEAIEDYATAHDDLGLANDATYALRALRSEEYGPIARALDYVLYRGAGGYFVRPSHPLLILAALIVVATLWRYGRPRAGAIGRRAIGRVPKRPPQRAFRVPRNRPGRLKRARRRMADLGASLAETIALAVPRWGGSRSAAPAGAARAEMAAYRILLVVALIGLANSNPALNRMLEALV